MARAGWSYILTAIFLSSAPALADVAELAVLSEAQVTIARREAREQLDDARSAVRERARKLGYSRDQIESALKPAMRRRGTIRQRLADGTIIEFPFFRTGYADNALTNTGKKMPRAKAGPRRETNKGGVRIHFGVFSEEVEALSLKMDLKLGITGDAIDGHSVRGAKGGIGAGKIVKVGKDYAGKVKVGDFIDPASPAIDRGRLMKEFARGYKAKGGKVGVGWDIQAGDVNTKQKEMIALSGAQTGRFEQARRLPFAAEHASIGVSGKPVIQDSSGGINPAGGVGYRSVSTGEGVWFSARHGANYAGTEIRGATVVSQGWGEVGRAFGMAALRDGAKVIAIEQVWKVDGKIIAGTLVHPKGEKATLRESKAWVAKINKALDSGADLRTFNRGELLAHLSTKTKIKGARAGKALDSSTIRADIVGVNALGGTLNDKTVPGYLASGTTQGSSKVIVEGANLAETMAGRRLLDKAKDRVVVIPGDLANLGGVHVSNLEAVQNLQARVVSNDMARSSLQETIATAWQGALTLANKHGTSIREAVELLATDRMMKRSLQLRGATRLSLNKRMFPRDTGKSTTSKRSKLAAIRSLKSRSTTSRPPVRPKHSTTPAKSRKTLRKTRTPRARARR